MENNSQFCALILAAGKGTRMKSDMAKVLHILEGKPLLHYSLQAAREAGAEKIVVIVGHQADRVRAAFPDPDLIFVDQMPQLGTGHAVMQAGAPLRIIGDLPSSFAAMCRF